jgi:uncharacterized transporter YbjL
MFSGAVTNTPALAAVVDVLACSGAHTVHLALGDMSRDGRLDVVVATRLANHGRRR